MGSLVNGLATMVNGALTHLKSDVSGMSDNVDELSNMVRTLSKEIKTLRQCVTPRQVPAMVLQSSSLAFGNTAHSNTLGTFIADNQRYLGYNFQSSESSSL